MITGYDHVQVAIPKDGEEVARGFYGSVLGMTEQPKPAALAARGGCWFVAGHAVLHLGVENPFTPARRAHPAFALTDQADLDQLHDTLVAAGHDCTWSAEIPGVRRFHSHDPFGNRLEFQAT